MFKFYLLAKAIVPSSHACHFTLQAVFVRRYMQFDTLFPIILFTLDITMYKYIAASNYCVIL